MIARVTVSFMIEWLMISCSKLSSESNLSIPVPDDHMQGMFGTPLQGFVPGTPGSMSMASGMTGGSMQMTGGSKRSYDEMMVIN